MTKVGDWLDGIGLGQYATIFDENDIGYSELPELTEGDLRSVGVSIGHMRRILRAIRDLQPVAAPTERRQVTVLFADIVGFTNLSSRLDPEDLLDVVNSFQAKSTATIEAYRGTVVKFVGDGLMAFFGWPVASEPDAINSVRAAQKLAQVLSKEIDVNGERLQIRSGVATGLAVVGDLASNMPDVFGDVPNLAARLQAIAEPGTVLISEGTHRLVSHVFDCTATGTLDIKGLGEVRAWTVQSERADGVSARLVAPSGSGQMQGRDEEFEALKALWTDVRGGQFKIACIEGEAGLGKSRLAKEFLSHVRKDATIVSLFGSPDAGQTPLRPIVDLIERASQFEAGEPETARFDKIDRMIEAASIDAEVYGPIFAGVCGLTLDTASAALSPERRKAMLFEGVKLILEARARSAPILVLFEDLHWLDSTTYELAHYLGGIDPSCPILLLATTRPDRAAPWSDDQNFLTVRLAPLSPAHSARFLQETLGGGNDVLANVIRQILERADGIPLYLEELSRSVHLTIDNLSIPSTLQDSLMARLDRLGDVREIAQVASILGRDIDEALLAEVLSKTHDNVTEGLERLVYEQVLNKTKVSGGAGYQYRFRHALLQEAAYDSQLRRKRREVHGAVGDVLIRWVEEGQGSKPATIAHHLSMAGRSAEAVGYYRQAGLLALSQAHYEDAEDLLQSALSELGGKPDASVDITNIELELQTELGSVLIAREGFAAEAVGAAFEQAERLGRELGPGPAMARALWGAWLYQLVSGNLVRALELSRELVALGEAFEALDEGGLLTEATFALGDTQFWVGDLEASIASLSQSVALYDPSAHSDHAVIFGQDPFVGAQCYMSYTQSIRGHHSASWAAQKAAIAHARTLGHPFSTAWALSFPAVVATYRGEAWVARRMAAAALRHTSEQIMPFWQTAMTIVHGWSRAKMGEVEEGLAEAQEGLALYAEIGSETVQPYFRGLVAECLSLAGRSDEAAEMLKSAFELAQKTGEFVSETRLHLFAAQLGEANGASLTDIEAHLTTAITQARDTGATATELDAALSLARLTGPAGVTALREALERSPEPTKSRTGRRALAFIADIDAGRSPLE